MGCSGLTPFPSSSPPLLPLLLPHFLSPLLPYFYVKDSAPPTHQAPKTGMKNRAGEKGRGRERDSLARRDQIPTSPETPSPTLSLSFPGSYIEQNDPFLTQMWAMETHWHLFPAQLNKKQEAETFKGIFLAYISLSFKVIMKAAGAESYQVLSTGLGFLAVVIHVSLQFRHSSGNWDPEKWRDFAQGPRWSPDPLIPKFNLCYLQSPLSPGLRALQTPGGSAFPGPTFLLHGPLIL